MNRRDLGYASGEHNTSMKGAVLVGRSRMLALVAAVSLFVANPPPAAAVTNGPTTAHSSYLSAISCPTAMVCVAVGALETDIDSASGRLIGGSFQAMAVRTTDAGKTWVPVELPVLDASLSAVSCWSAAQCVAVGATHVTSHGSWWAASAVVVRIEGGTGSRAAAIPSGAKALDAVSCPSATTCIAAGGAFMPGTVALHPDVLVSHDGGASWAGAVLPIAQGQLESVSCSSTSHCVALGASSYKRGTATFTVDLSKPVGLISSDGGLSWKVATVPGGSGGPTAVACQSASHCLAVGDDFTLCLCGTGTPGHYAGSWVTDDGGATWSKQVLPTLGGYDVWYANALSCWATACAMAGTATTTKLQSAYYAIFQLLSSSGGPSGPPSTSASGLRRQYIYGLSCRDASNCIAVGQDWSKPAAAAIETWASGRWTTTFIGPVTTPSQPLVAATPCPGPAQVVRSGAKDGPAPGGSLFDGLYRLGPAGGSLNPTSGTGPFGRLGGVYADILVCAPHPDSRDSGDNTSAWVMLQKFGVAADHWQVGWEWYPRQTNLDPAVLVEVDQPGPTGGANNFADCDNLKAASSVGLTCYKTPCSETTSSRCWPTLKVGYYAFFTVLYNGTTFSAYVNTENPLTGKYSGPKEVAQVRAKFVPDQADISTETHYIDDQIPGTPQYPERFLYSHVYVPGLRWVAFDGHEKFNGHDVFFTTVDGVSTSSWFGQSSPNGQELLVWDKDAV